MKIAVVVSTYPPYKGGMGNVAATHADAFRSSGHDVTALSPGVSLTPLFRYGNAAVVPQLLWKLRGFDAVELHYPFFGGAEWVWLWKKLFGRGKTLIVFYHMDTVGKGWLGLMFRLYRRLFLKRILGAADRIAVTSRDYLASSHVRELADDARVREIPLSVDAVRFSPATSLASDVAHGRRRALFVGGLDRAHYFKGVGVLLESFARVAPEFPDATLAIVGDGDLRAGYEAKARELGLAGRVAFLGKVADEDLPAAYRAASFLVLPSLDRSEAFGLVTLEAAASGIPAIVSDLPGVRTVVETGETGLIVPPDDIAALADAMRKLFGDSVLAGKMGIAARERVMARYANEVIGRRLADLLP